MNTLPLQGHTSRRFCFSRCRNDLVAFVATRPVYIGNGSHSPGILHGEHDV